MAIKCCKDCVPPTRYPGCHAKCERYKAEKAELDKENKIIRANKAVMFASYDFDDITLSTYRHHKK